MTGPSAERRSGTGLGGSPLVPLRSRPTIALSVDILRELTARHVRIDPVKAIDFEAVADLPGDWLAALAQAGLLARV